MTKHEIPENEPQNGPVCAIGNFDGVHLGHLRLFSICADLAKKNGCGVCAVTFDGLQKDGGRLISSPDRRSLLFDAGAGAVICEDFTEICDMSPEEYIYGRFIPRLSPSAVVCGGDFRFGRGGAGDASELGRLLGNRGIPLVVADTVMADGEPVSTSRIKRELSLGNVKSAEILLGRRYSFAFPVTVGRRLGRRLGAPTVNQVFPAGMFVPVHGVYAGDTEISGKIYPCVTNIGVRPTVDDSGTVTAESHIIGYDGDLYGQVIRIKLSEFIRGEVKFPSLDALAAQISEDAEHALSVYRKRREFDI